MSKKPNPALAPRERTLAERTLDKLLDGDNSIQHPDTAIEILNLSFLEAQADERMDEVEPWDLTLFPKRFHAVVNGERLTFVGEVPAVNTLFRVGNLTYFVGSHK